MAHSKNGEFYKYFVSDGYDEFKYKDMYFNVGEEVTGVFHKKVKLIFVLHRHDNTGTEIYSEYKTPSLLMDNVRIDGKTLQELWPELELCD